VAYGSVLATKTEPGTDAARVLLQQYATEMRRKSRFTELRNLHALDELKHPLEQCAYAYEDHLNYLVDLDRSCDAVFGGISSSTRKKIRRAMRSGEVTVEELTERADLPEWYELLRHTYRRARVPVPHRSLFEAAFDVLQPRSMIKFFVARVRGVAVACSAELLYKQTIYGWYGGSDRAYSSYIPNDLLTWHVLEWGASNGYRVYDFGGAGKPDEPYGVRTFKAKYGGELVNYGRYVCVHSRGRLAISRIAYRAYQSAPRADTVAELATRRWRDGFGRNRERSDARSQIAEGLIDMQIAHVSSHRRDDWNAFVAEDPSFALLQSWEWGEFKERLGWKAFRIAAESHGRMIAAAQLLIKPAPGRVASVAYVPRGPVGEWNDDGVARALLDEIHRIARRHRAVFLRVEPPRLDNSPAARLLEVLLP
jgi:lipid II:glycine glycyltransferase (peptidoglycan interpeptide bridge formation enzyme)